MALSDDHHDFFPVEDTEALRAKYPDAFFVKPPMLPGTVIADYVRCGKSSCKCSRGEPHGPYFYWTRWEEEGLRRTYVPKSELPAVVAMCLNRKVLQSMVRENRQRYDSTRRAMRSMIRNLQWEMRTGR